MLKLNNVKKVFNQNKVNELIALSNINLNIKEGESVAIIGPSGAGKTTLMHLIAGLDRPTEGEILFKGENVVAYNDKELSAYRNINIGFIMQDFHLINNSTVLDNVILPLYLQKNKKKNYKKIAQKHIYGVDLEDKVSTKVKVLSGGEKQRVAIARALVTDPYLLLGDEPTGSLDTQNSINIMEMLARINDKGKTLIIITHNMEVANYCKRIIELRDGRIINDSRT